MILIRCCLRSFFRVRPPGESRGSAAATPARGGFRFALLLATLGIFGAAASAAEFTLQWNDNSGNEEGFQVERALGTSGTFSVIAKVGANVTSYRDANLEPATQYRYRVRAFNTAGSSAYSNTASDTTKSTSSNDVITVNTPPAITAINAQTATSGSKKSVTFTLSDATTNVGNLKVVASTSEPHLIPQSSLVLSGTSATRTLSFTPVKGIVGTAEITVAVHDNEYVAYRRFKVTVTGGNGTPPPATTPRSRISQLTLLGKAGPSPNGLDLDFTTTKANKSILVRAVGPTLESALSLKDAMRNPRLELWRGSTSVLSNNNWGGTSALRKTFTAVGALALPNDSLDAAALKTLSPSDYRLSVFARDGHPVARVLAEIYDADTASSPSGRLTKLKTRTSIGTGDNAPVLGFTITANDTRTLLIRTVSTRGSTSTNAPRPRMEIYRGKTLVQRIEGWTPKADIIAATGKVGASDLTNLADAAVLFSAAPGAYTVVISSGSGATANGSIELYEVR